MSKKIRNPQHTNKIDAPPTTENPLGKNTKTRKPLWIWGLFAAIIISIGYFFSRGNYVWVVIFTAIGIIILTKANQFSWKKHLFPILAGVLLLGSWIAENTAQAKWTAEKDHVLYWLQLQEAKFNDMGQWQIAVQQYRYPYEKKQHWRDTLKNDRNYANLCRNWLQLFYTLISIDSQISMELTRKEKLAMGDRLSHKMEALWGDRDSAVVDLYTSELQHSSHVVRDSGNRVLVWKEELENREKKWNEIFKWCYFIGSIFLAINYILKEIFQVGKV